MTEKEKQIEEMAIILSKDCGHCEDCDCVSDKDFNCTDYFYAKELYNAGYRKVLEGAVVLTREEWRDLHKSYGGMLYILRQEVRKDTAKEFAEKLKYTLIINNEENTEFFDYQETLETIDEIAKQCGVEVDE